ncbi:MAG: tetratricopeptide repeat protein [bacterium]|nr:tetratricopeptide repeat protein [bacterium]
MSRRYAIPGIPGQVAFGANARIWIVAAVAVIVRLLYVIDAADDPAAFVPLVDAGTYHGLAVGLADEGRLDESFLWQSTFYPFFLSAVYKVAGASILAAKVIQILLAGITCLLTVRLGRRLFGDTAGLMAGLVVAFHGPLIFFDVQLLATGWATFWSVALATLAVDLADRPRIRTGLLLGGAAALAVLTRPSFVPVAIALVAWLAWEIRRLPDRRPGWLSLAAAVLACGLVLAPYALAMRAATGHAGVVPPSGGINLHIGNNPDYARTINFRPGFGWEKLLAEPQIHGHAPDPWSGQPWFIGQVRSFAREHPGTAAGLLGRKAAQLVSSRELSRTFDVYLHREWSALLSTALFKLGPWGFPCGLLLPLAAVGLLRNGTRGAGSMLVILGVLGASLVLVFVTARYRAPLVPLLAILAGHGVVTVWRMVRGRETRRLAVAAALVLATVVIGTAPGPFAQEDVDLTAELHFGVGWNRYRQEDWVEAVRHLQRAVELDPALPAAHNFLGIALVRLDEPEEAVRHFETAVRLKPGYAEAVNNLRVGRTRLADTLMRRAETLAQAGRYEEAADAAKQARDLATTTRRPDLVNRITHMLQAYREDRPWQP